jgi:hypothetical protein
MDEADDVITAPKYDAAKLSKMNYACESKI